MKFLSGVLIVALTVAVMIALVTRPADIQQAKKPLTLGDRVEAACKPYLVSDWHVDYTDKTLIVVDCYEPRTSNVKSTVVER